MTLGKQTLNDLVAPISKRLKSKEPPVRIEAPAHFPIPVRATDGLSQEQLVDMFADEAEKVRVSVHRATAANLTETIAAIVSGEEAGGVVCADDDRFQACGLVEGLKAHENVTALHVWDASLGRQNVEEARVARYGITYASAGIAETGTIVQPTCARCGRSISLLPLVHIAVVDANSIVGTMADVLKDYKKGTLPSQLCFISGPSATADIELVRVEGVHGPMYVHYVIVE